MIDDIRKFMNISENLNEDHLFIGQEVKVPHKGKMVLGKIVRWDAGINGETPYYIVDVGESESIKVPEHKLENQDEKISEELDYAADDSVNIEHYTLPTYWASALINGDMSGYDDEEISQINAFIDSILQEYERAWCLDMGEDMGFMKYHDASDFGVLATDCADYAFDVGKRHDDDPETYADGMAARRFDADH